MKSNNVIWITVVLIILCGAYYWVVVDSNRLEEMSTLEKSDTNLKGDVNEWSEYYKEQNKKWIGTSKHVKTLQEETKEHYSIYDEKVDSINNSFDRIEFKIEQLNERLMSKIDKIENNLDKIDEEFGSYKRATDRKNMMQEKEIKSIKLDIESIKARIKEEFGDEEE